MSRAIHGLVGPGTLPYEVDDFADSEFGGSCISLSTGSTGFQTSLVTCITSYNCASCSDDIWGRASVFDVDSNDEARDSHFLKYCGIESLALVSVSVRTGWQLIQIHLPLCEEPHYVRRVRDVLVPAKFWGSVRGHGSFILESK